MDELNGEPTYDRVGFITDVFDFVGTALRRAELPRDNSHPKGLEVCTSGNDWQIPRPKAPGTLIWRHYVDVF